MLFRHRARLLIGAAALVGMGSSGGAWANTLDVIATVPEVCTVQAGTLDFGEYASGQATTLEASGTFDVQCSVDADVDVALDAGAHPEAAGNGVRAMSNASASHFLGYRLFRGGASDEWGGPGYSSGAPQNFDLAEGTTSITVDGQILADQSPIGGVYSDTVVISLEFN